MSGGEHYLRGELSLITIIHSGPLGAVLLLDTFPFATLPLCAES